MIENRANIRFPIPIFKQRKHTRIQGAGLGLRRDLVDQLLDLPVYKPAFVEFAPENWMGNGRPMAKKN